MFGMSKTPAALSAYAGLPLTLPSGESCVGRIPTLKEALEYLGLFERARKGDQKAAAQLVEKFPKAVGLEAELNRLTLAEFYEVLARFFSPRSPTTPPGEPTPAETPSATTRDGDGSTGL